MLARTKQTPPPTLPERIRQAAAKVRDLDVELKEVVDLYLDEQKATQAGAPLPRGVLHQMMVNKYGQPWTAILALEAELP
jgi:hypothetical protein